MDACGKLAGIVQQSVIEAYNASGFFEPIEGDIQTFIHSEVGAANVTGLMIDLVIKERRSVCG